MMRSQLQKIAPLVRLVRGVRRVRQLAERRRERERYFEEQSVTKLQIGTSINVLDGWFNVDIIPLYEGAFFMDATKPFPFDDASFDYIFSEHMIEHIEYHQAQFMLAECHRILKPGGRIRIATPDLEVLANLYVARKSPEQNAYIDEFFRIWFPDVKEKAVGLVVNQVFDFDHKFLFDPETLRDSLASAGFRQVTRSVPGQSQDPVLAGIDAHAMDYIRFETVVMEAVK